MPSKNPLIIALDYSSSRQALSLVRSLKYTGVAFKVGFELFTSYGPKIVEKIINHDVRVFLDLKFHDIPHTVAHASDVATRMGVWMFNVHASGGVAMMQAAKEASMAAAADEGLNSPIVLAVTVLTSFADLQELNVPLSVSDQVFHLSRLAQESSLDGVVCSAHEAQEIRQRQGENFSLVTPGIRLSLDDPNDQKRVMTPAEAIKKGSTYLVMGRSITRSRNPLNTVEAVMKDIKL